MCNEINYLGCEWPDSGPETQTPSYTRAPAGAMRIRPYARGPLSGMWKRTGQTNTPEAANRQSPVGAGAEAATTVAAVGL